MGRLLLLLAVATSGWAQTAAIPSRARSANTFVTFNNQVVRIFQKHCQVCHHPGDIGPFSLMSYREAYPYAREIKRETQERRMPPWKPVAGHGEFLDENRLNAREMELIARWVDLGAPEGDPRDLPPPLDFSEQWTLGTPDLVVEPETSYAIAAEGAEIYRCFSIPVNLPSNQWITGVEVRPGARSVAHHVLLFEDALGLSARLGDAQTGYPCFGGPGFLPSGAIGGWAPGNRPQVFPPGLGIQLRANARIVMQVHYHPNGQAQVDRTRVGLFFAKEPIRKEIFVLPLLNSSFVIPPGAARHTVTESFVVPPPLSARAIAITPHMHLLGREIRVEVRYPNGTRRPLIYIDDWDFQWQATYYFREPVPLPSLTRIELTAVYDNSSANPRNPNSPPKEVRWGEATTDEMCIAFIAFTVD